MRTLLFLSRSHSLNAIIICLFALRKRLQRLEPRTFQLVNVLIFIIPIWFNDLSIMDFYYYYYHYFLIR